MEPFAIQVKHCDMMKYGYQAMTHFPKSERFALCAQIKDSATRALGVMVRANLARKDKLPLLADLDVELKVLQSFVRLSFELGFLPPKKYELWSGKIAEEGRMLGGLIRRFGSPQGRG